MSVNKISQMFDLDEFLDVVGLSRLCGRGQFNCKLVCFGLGNLKGKKTSQKMFDVVTYLKHLVK